MRCREVIFIWFGFCCFLLCLFFSFLLLSFAPFVTLRLSLCCHWCEVCLIPAPFHSHSGALGQHSCLLQKVGDGFRSTLFPWQYIFAKFWALVFLQVFFVLQKAQGSPLCVALLGWVCCLLFKGMLLLSVKRVRSRRGTSSDLLLLVSVSLSQESDPNWEVCREQLGPCRSRCHLIPLTWRNEFLIAAAQDSATLV